jgi:hypothetical protein
MFVLNALIDIIIYKLSYLNVFIFTTFRLLIGKSLNSGNSRVVNMAGRLFKDPDSELVEYLTRSYDTDFMKARSIARRMTFANFAEAYDTLSALIGEDYASQVVEKGKFLDYRNGTMEEYHALAREAVGRIEEVTEDVSRAFYSIPRLKAFLYPQDNGTTVTVDCSNLELADCKILHKDNPQSRMYLDTLIEEGELSVGIHEHWCKARNNNAGPRGLNIIRKMTYQLALAFSQVGYKRLEYDINHGQCTLKISDNTRKRLRTLRASAYKVQNGD